MKTKSRILCGILTAATAVSLLSGCGDQTQPASSADEKLTCWLPLTRNAAMLVSNYGETALAKELIKKTGVNVEFVHPPQGQESEKFSIIVSSSDMPDIIEYNWLNYPGGPAKAIKEGVIIDIAKYENQAPNVF